MLTLSFLSFISASFLLSSSFSLIFLLYVYLYFLLYFRLYFLCCISFCFYFWCHCFRCWCFARFSAAFEATLLSCRFSSLSGWHTSISAIFTMLAIESRCRHVITPRWCFTLLPRRRWLFSHWASRHFIIFYFIFAPCQALCCWCHWCHAEFIYAYIYCRHWCYAAISFSYCCLYCFQMSAFHYYQYLHH